MAEQFHSRVVWLTLGFAAACGSAFSSGCASVIAYQPQEKLVDEIGVQEATTRLQGVMTRAAAPVVNSVNVTDDFFLYHFQEPIPGPYGIHMGNIPNNRQIFYTNIQRLEIYDNHYVFIYGPGDALISQILYSNDQDAKTYADIVMSFRTRKLRGGAASTPAPAPAPAPPPSSSPAQK